MMTPDALRMMAAADLLPISKCPIDGWIPLDCPALDDGIVPRCPCCLQTVAAKDIVFMDDAGRRAHGIEVHLLEDPTDQDGSVGFSWPLRPVR